MFSYAIHPEARLVVARFAAGIDAAEILAFFTQLEADPAYDRTMNGLVDARGTEIEMTLEDIRGLARHVLERGFKNGNWAILVDQPKATALSMLYTKAVDAQYSFQVFSTARGISEFLGINAADFLGPTASQRA